MSSLLCSPSRFPTTVTFADFSAMELALILQGKVGAIPPTRGATGDTCMPLTIDIKTALVLGRRLTRGAGARGFGNARDLENRIPGIRQRWHDSLDLSQPLTPAHHVLTPELVLGERPNPETGAVGAILRELDALVGLGAVKASFRGLVAAMAVAYDEDLLGRPQTNAGLLNRVFQGPPGACVTPGSQFCLVGYTCRVPHSIPPLRVFPCHIESRHGQDDRRAPLRAAAACVRLPVQGGMRRGQVGGPQGGGRGRV